MDKTKSDIHKTAEAESLCLLNLDNVSYGGPKESRTPTSSMPWRRSTAIL